MSGESGSVSRMGFAPVLGKPMTQILPGENTPVSRPGAVLFACTFNSIRSPMAAALAKHVTGGKIYIDSVGVKTEPINPFIVEVMAERGIDLSNFQPKSFDDLVDSSFDLIVTLSPHAQHHAVALTDTWSCDVEFWPTIDPAGALDAGSREQKLDIFRALRDALEARIRQRLCD